MIGEDLLFWQLVIILSGGGKFFLSLYALTSITNTHHSGLKHVAGLVRHMFAGYKTLDIFYLKNLAGFTTHTLAGFVTLQRLTNTTTVEVG